DDSTRASVANRFIFQLGETIEHQATLNCRAIIADGVRQTFERLPQSYPGNAASSHEKVGEVLVARGDLAGALKCYRDSLAIRERLARADPGHAGWQRELSVSYEMIGDVQLAQGDTAGALTSYRGSLAIRERLARADPGNANLQRDLEAAYGKV